VHFNITIARDVLFAPAVRKIADRAAQCAGFASADAIRLAASVGRAAETLLARDSAEGGETVEVRFEHDARVLDVTFRYRPAGGGRPGASVDPSLSGDALRQGMDSVEFGADGAIEYCRLRRALPREKVDHQCEMPPGS
jgi:hypothetical protein